MAIVVRRDARRAARAAAQHPGGIVLSVGEADTSGDAVARIGLSVKDAALARQLAVAMARALRRAAAKAPAELPVVRVRSRKALAGLGLGVAGAIAIVPVTPRNLRRVGEIVEALRAAGVAGVQLVWDGGQPSRHLAEARVFAVLERARETPGLPPVVLASSDDPVEALRILVAARRQARGA